jgi:hypothetical protein
VLGQPATVAQAEPADVAPLVTPPVAQAEPADVAQAGPVAVIEPGPFVTCLHCTDVITELSPDFWVHEANGRAACDIAVTGARTMATPNR